jgi:hypothetical protein
VTPLGELRAATLEARLNLDTILDRDRELAARVAAAIDAAFAQAPQQAGRALRAALMIDVRVRNWVRGLVATVPAPADRFSGPDAGPPITTGGDDSSAVGDTGPRVLRAQTQERIESGRRLTVRVDIGTTGPGTPLPHLAVPPEGAEVLVRVSAPGLQPRGELQRLLTVPAGHDSDPVLFEFLAGAPGLHQVRVEAYRRGTFLGRVLLPVTVEASVQTAEGPVRASGMPSVGDEPGEVTLIVDRVGDGYRFQLIGARTYRPVPASTGAAARATAAIVAELTALAAGRSAYRTASAVERRLRNLGVDLWRNAIPDPLKEQYWAEVDRIGSLTIVADDADFPFELLRPMSEKRDDGFLVERFPVLRRAFDTDRARSMARGTTAYVLSYPEPGNARAEVAGIQALLAGHVGGDRLITGLDDVQDAARLRGLGMLHLACHNEFSDSAGSWVPMDGGPWMPSDLSPATLTRPLAETATLVFFNACRSAGEVRGLSATSGWADQFMRAGAGAFIGSLWAVRSSAARAFAEAFYAALVDQRQNLGDAALTARRSVPRDAGDPTWLAYTVYGEPSTTFGDPAP